MLWRNWGCKVSAGAPFSTCGKEWEGKKWEEGERSQSLMQAHEAPAHQGGSLGLRTAHHSDHHSDNGRPLSPGPLGPWVWQPFEGHGDADGADSSLLMALPVSVQQTVPWREVSLSPPHTLANEWGCDGILLRFNMMMHDTLVPITHLSVLLCSGCASCCPCLKLGCLSFSYQFVWVLSIFWIWVLIHRLLKTSSLNMFCLGNFCVPQGHEDILFFF